MASNHGSSRPPGPASEFVVSQRLARWKQCAAAVAQELRRLDVGGWADGMHPVAEGFAINTMGETSCTRISSPSRTWSELWRLAPVGGQVPPEYEFGTYSPSRDGTHGHSRRSHLIGSLLPTH